MNVPNSDLGGAVTIMPTFVHRILGLGCWRSNQPRIDLSDDDRRHMIIYTKSKCTEIFDSKPSMRYNDVVLLHGYQRT